LQAAINWLKQADELTPPAGFREAVLSRVEQEQNRNRVRRPPVFAQALAAAAVFILLVAGNVAMVRPSMLMKTETPLSIMEEASPAEEDQIVNIMGREASDELPDQPRAAAVPPLNDADDAGYGGESEPSSERVNEAARGRDSGRVFLAQLLLNLILLPLLAMLIWRVVRKPKEA
jgi:ABC-type uncharacterized transport system involved in gliding motility auxiliary subunit